MQHEEKKHLRQWRSTTIYHSVECVDVSLPVTKWTNSCSILMAKETLKVAFEISFYVTIDMTTTYGNIYIMHTIILWQMLKNVLYYLTNSSFLISYNLQIAYLLTLIYIINQSWGTKY